MTQVVTTAEIAALLRMAGVAPAQTSPLSGLQPGTPDKATIASLAAKGAYSPGGVLDPEWHAMMLTLADPLMQASVHVEGVGGGQYYGGAGGVSGFAQLGDGQFRVIGGWSVDAIVEELDAVLRFRAVPDGPPLRQDLSVGELTVVAALADAHREEQLRACIERRAARSGAVTRELAAEQLEAGTSRADHRWLISILSQFAAPGNGPDAEHLDAGAASLVARRLAGATDGALALNADLQLFCSGFATVTPFLGLAVHEPWADPEVKLFTRGVQNFWGIEYLNRPASSKVRLSRLGGRAMESLMRQHLAALGAHTGAPASPIAPVATVAPVTPVVVPAPASPATCSKCGRVAKVGARFCAGCGSALAS